MALQLSNLVGEVLLNGVVASPNAVLVPHGCQPAELTVLAGASVDLVQEGAPPDRIPEKTAAKVKFTTGEALSLTIQHQPGSYLTRRSQAPATYDLQTDWGRVIIREGGHTP